MVWKEELFSVEISLLGLEHFTIGLPTGMAARSSNVCFFTNNKTVTAVQNTFHPIFYDQKNYCSLA